MPSMSCVDSPPGLSLSDSAPESATRSRERRRVALAVNHAISQVENAFMQRLQDLDDKLEQLLDIVGNLSSDRIVDRVRRLETLVVCTQPSVDDVLDSMLCKSKQGRDLPGVKDLQPTSASCSSTVSSVDTNQIYDKAVMFDIYDNLSDVGVQTDSSQDSQDLGAHGNEHVCEIEDVAPTLVGDWRALPQESWCKLYTCFHLALVRADSSKVYACIPSTGHVFFDAGIHSRFLRPRESIFIREINVDTATVAASNTIDEFWTWGTIPSSSLTGASIVKEPA